jgi:mannosyl-3-phosphoglycerate phosphatase
LATVIDAADLPITQGGRFFHFAASDKGQAVSMLMALFKRSHPGAVSVGIGDALNDLPLLKAVDIPILVQGSNGSYHPGVAVPDLRYADGIGPAGWNAAIASLVDGAPTGLTQ